LLGVFVYMLIIKMSHENIGDFPGSLNAAFAKPWSNVAKIYDANSILDGIIQQE